MSARALLFAALAVAWTLPVRALDDAPSVGSVFGEAVELYRDQRYGAALEGFVEALEHETDRGRRAVLHFDAGTAAARADRLGEAVWHLEAARRLDPSLSEAETNLAMVRARLRDDDEGGAPPPSFTDTLVRLPLAVTETTSRRGAAVLVALALLGFVGWRAGWWGRRGAWLSVALLVAALGWRVADGVARAIDLERAVVVGDAVAVRGEPQADVDVLYRLSAGSVVRVERELDGWRLVTARNDARGWVDGDDVRPAGR